MNIRISKTEGHQLQQTFGTKPKQDQNQTRIRLLASFQQSYLEDQKQQSKHISSISKQLSQEKQQRQQLLNALKQRIYEQSMLLHIERQVHDYLLQRIQNRYRKGRKVVEKNTINQASLELLQCSDNFIQNIEKLDRMLSGYKQ